MIQSMFKTPAGEARYFAAYDATLALWPVPVSPVTVSTQYGPTHVNVCGPEDGPALLLLHGSAISSTMWYPNVAALSQRYRVYAPDIPGEMGKSIRTRPMETDSSYCDWLVDLLEGLQLDRLAVVGISFGGYLGIQLATTAPERVAKLVLLSPATLLSMRAGFIFRMIGAILVPWMSIQTRQRLFLGSSSENVVPVVKQMMATADFKYKMFLPKVTSDAALKQIQAPTLLLIGAQEILYPPRAAVQRAARLIPHIETEIIPNAGHALNLDQPDQVNQRILAFLDSA